MPFSLIVSGLMVSEWLEQTGWGQLISGDTIHTAMGDHHYLGWDEMLWYCGYFEISILFKQPPIHDV